MFLIKKLIPSLNIEGKRKNAGIIYVDSKNNIFEEVEEGITLRGGLAHSANWGLMAIFLSPDNTNEIVKTAIEIMQRSKALGVRVKIGINAGDLIVEELPTGIVKYASLGNSVSYAKKLAKIENGIVVSDEIQKKIAGSFRFEKLENGWLIKGIIPEKW